MQFIKAHINEPISVDDIIEVSGKSRAYLFKKFKTELGVGIGEYISHCRLREAKSLLRYTDKPISEISNYLCYSSQSHFQNAFKYAAVEIGLFPKEFVGKMEAVGNTSLEGAYRYGLADAPESELKELLSKVQELNLAESEGFEETYINAMNF